MWFRRKNSTQQDTISTQPAQEPTFTRTFRGSGRELSLTGMAHRVAIQSGPYSEITAEVTGPQFLLDELTIGEDNGLSIVCGDTWRAAMRQQWRRKGSLWEAIAHMPRAVARGVALIKASQLTVSITVPEGTELCLWDQQGVLEAHGTYGKVMAEVGYAGRVTLGTITGLWLDTNSSTNVTVETLAGSCEAQLAFDSRLAIDGGNVPAMRVKTDASTSLMLKADCQSLDYAAGFGSQFYAANVKGTLMAVVDASATVEANFTEALECVIRAGSDSRVMCTGLVRRASIKADSSVEATFGAVSDAFRAELGCNSVAATQSGSGTKYVTIITESDCEVRLVGAVLGGNLSLGFANLLKVGELSQGVRLIRDDGAVIETGFMAQ